LITAIRHASHTPSGPGQWPTVMARADAGPHARPLVAARKAPTCISLFKPFGPSNGLAISLLSRAAQP
jgi:hypothetical protein